MKSASFGAAQDKRGFTLVELLVVIAIIAILSTVGVVTFRGVTSGARDAARKADLNAISKAYEVKYTANGVYSTLVPEDFASGKIPQNPKGGNYTCVIGPGCQTPSDTTFRVCAPLESNPVSDCGSTGPSCYCVSSTQGSVASGGGGGGGGGYVDHPSCDTTSTLGFGLVGYWKLDEGRGSTTIDSSRNGLNATLTNNPTWIPTSDISPSFINGVSFNGTSQQVTTPVSSLTQFTASGSYTISAWVYLDQYQLPLLLPDGRLCCGSRIAYNNSGAGGFDWRIWNNGALNFYRPSTWCAASSGNIKVPLNSWVNLVATYNNQQVYLYMNGNRIASRNTCNFLDSSVAVRFNYPRGNHGLYGDMDDLRIYNRALSPDEISALYSDGDGCIPQ